MGQSITQLISKMLFTEHLSQRISISQSIFKMLHASTHKESRIAKVIRKHFKSRIKACALNPSSRHRKSLCELAKFYDAYIDDAREISKAA
jgi:hypothetical protein